MAESKFSLAKIASFFGACILFVLAIVCVALGIYMITANNVFYGVASICGGAACFAISAFVYDNYQKKY
jgi:hypothetical protein